MMDHYSCLSCIMAPYYMFTVYHGPPYYVFIVYHGPLLRVYGVSWPPITCLSCIMAHYYVFIVYHGPYYVFTVYHGPLLHVYVYTFYIIFQTHFVKCKLKKEKEKKRPSTLPLAYIKNKVKDSYSYICNKVVCESCRKLT